MGPWKKAKCFTWYSPYALQFLVLGNEITSHVCGSELENHEPSIGWMPKWLFTEEIKSVSALVSKILLLSL